MLQSSNPISKVGFKNTQNSNFPKTSHPIEKLDRKDHHDTDASDSKGFKGRLVYDFVEVVAKSPRRTVAAGESVSKIADMTDHSVPAQG